ncbi:MULTISPECIES: EboA domain-containing protein [Mucilaginibacter]|uniref:EboA domain-containing protein n=1 Tax=Mucilaginibacter rubeus TaxID=2027860 RepID=A0ABX7U4H8_9SPHI|nr:MULTISPECIES: EboA domain-containing protein [Mucilaginibacter]QTE41118.1 EboA domain-containing protein [Mucilaginibacter rubeus]QTE47721.1 EboA domain-containing protein [Mucilaginibacter rubeus]QTE59112.1 EboA domain-containing protein [Mucilaginibacter rubeus]QTE61427.1 EboA domain-containing protein [Mucilaginibacter rubeus]QTF60186.1 EboA domain-containing protein [Mucilaginibacter rubeus]
MFTYDIEKFKPLLTDLIARHVSPDAKDWLLAQGNHAASAAAFNAAFAALPRKTGKAPVNAGPENEADLSAIRKDFSIAGWSVDRLARVWLLLTLDTTDKERYQRNIENLFLAAEMNELVALYSALPLLAYAPIWVQRCTEGNRSNLGVVLEAIMYRNPYPAENLPEPAWNQMVLKALFTEKKLELITGLDQRANAGLAHTLIDYARERWSAGRSTDPMLWRLVSHFMDEAILQDIREGLPGLSELEREAVALAIAERSFQPAKELLKVDPLKMAAGRKTSWNEFINDTKN